MAHVPALDGLRAVAVVAVIAYHYDVPGFSGGFLGVDLFFVLSGFLITALLLRERSVDGSVDVRAFWVRRARRLMPAAVVMIAVVATWGWFAVPAHQLDRLRGDLLATLGYVANWRFIASGQSYFDLSSEPSPLRHAWSLAIEEQFYLLWPVVVAALLRLGRGRRQLLAVFASIAAAMSAVTMAVLHRGSDPSRAYYGTDTRAMQLLVGALLALWWVGRDTTSSTRRTSLGWIALTAVVVPLYVVDDGDAFLYSGGFLVFSVAAALLIFSVVDGRSSVSTLLSWRPLTAVGTVSYGLYLWHWPVQIAISDRRTALSGAALTVTRLAVTASLALASYVVLERPIRRRRGWGALRGWRAPLTVAGSIGVATSLTFLATAAAVPPPRYLTGEVGAVAESGSTSAPRQSAGGISDRRVLLIGDSVALSLEDGMTDVAAERDWSFAMVARWSCAVTKMAPADHGCTVGHSDFLARIEKIRAPIIIWFSNWDGPVNFYDAFEGTDTSRGTLTDSMVFLRRLDDVVDRLTASGSRVFFVLGPTLAPSIDNPAWDANVTRARQLYRVYNRFEPVRTEILDLSGAICGESSVCPDVVDGVSLRPLDGVHFGPDGAHWVAEWLFDRLQTSTGAPMS